MSNFNKRIFGCRIIEVINSNLNDGFDDYPRQMPDGTIFCSDVSIKYLDRHYFGEVLGKELFAKTTSEVKGDKIIVDTLKQSLEKKMGKKATLPNILSFIYKNETDEGCIDARLFGCVCAAEKATYNATGIIQYTQGINKLENTQIQLETINSPFPTKENDVQTTLGKYHVLDHAAFAVDFVLNPENVKNIQKNLPDGYKIIDEEDVELFKDATTKSATMFRTRRKSNNFDVFSIFITMKEGSKKVLPKNVNDFLEIKETSNGTLSVDMNNLKFLLEEDECESIEVRYSSFINVICDFKEADKVVMKETLWM